VVAQPSEEPAQAMATSKSLRAGANDRAENRRAGWAANIAIVCIKGV
jgi:hypothetical protein